MQHLNELTKILSRLPGLGPKSAHRLALYLALFSENDYQKLVRHIDLARSSLHVCQNCHQLSQEGTVCACCQNLDRQEPIICLLATVQDVLNFKKAIPAQWRVHVLNGLLSPLNGVGPDQLTFKSLQKRLVNEGIKEVVMALNPTTEGEITAMYVSQILKPLNITMSKLAVGIPVGSQLEYMDSETLKNALQNRLHVN